MEAPSGHRGLIVLLSALAIGMAAGWAAAGAPVQHGSYLELDGKDSGATTDLVIGQASRAFTVTMEAWVYPGSVSPGRHPVLSTDDGGYDWSLLHEGGRWHVFTGSRSAATGFDVDVRRWQHVAAVFSGGHVVFYKDGQASASMPLAYEQQAKPLAIGRSSHYPQFFDGRITEVRIWGRALDAEEIRAGMHAQLEGQMEHLIGYWRLDEGVGTVAQDLSGHEHHAELSGGARLLGEKKRQPVVGRVPDTKQPKAQPEPEDEMARILAALLDGDAEHAAEILLGADRETVQELVAEAETERPTETFLVLDGAGDLVTTGLELDQSSAASKVTMEAWVYPTETSSARTHVITTDNSGYDWSLLHEKGRWHVYTNRGSADTGVAVDKGRWQHVAVVYADGRATFYKDGRPTEVGDVRFETNADAVSIGGNAKYRQYFAGRIDEVRIWVRALSASEIQANMRRELTGEQQGLVGYWRLNGEHGGRVPDLSGHGHHGSLEGQARIASE